jgi:hypothetical protein
MSAIVECNILFIIILTESAIGTDNPTAYGSSPCQGEVGRGRFFKGSWSFPIGITKLELGNEIEHEAGAW